MSEWRTVKLGSVLPFKYGKSLPDRERSHSGEYAVVSSAGFIDSHSEPLTTGPTVVIGRKGTIGSVFFSAEPVFPIDTTFYVEGSNEVDIRFSYYLLKSLQLPSMNTDAAVPGLRREYAELIDVSVPSVRRQEQIAEVLSSIDDLIENNRRRVQLLEEMARAIYREWFVKFRYPGHESVPLVDSVMGPIPKGWEATTVGGALELRYGKALKADVRRGGKVAVMSSAGVVGWHDESLTEGPTIVVGRKGNVGSVHWVDGPSWTIDTAYFVSSNLPPRFLFGQIQGIEFVNTHSAVPGLSRESAYAQPFLVPAARVMEEFELVTNELGGQVSTLINEAETLVLLRDALLPRLVTGKIDVSKLNLDDVLEGEKVA